MSEEPKLNAAKRPNGLRSMADGMIYLAGETGVETANLWKTVDILRAAADEMERLQVERDEAREALGLTMREIDRMREGADAAILQLATVMKLPRPLTIDETIEEAAK